MQNPTLAHAFKHRNDALATYLLMSEQCSGYAYIYILIIKIIISSIVIGLKNSYFPLNHSPSCYPTACYRTVCYRTVQQTNQPITTIVSITIETVYKLLNLCIFVSFLM